MLVDNWNIEVFDKVNSTNLIVKDKISRGVGAGYVAWTKCQTNGRGTRGHSWQSPLGGVYFSILLDFALDSYHLQEIPLKVSEVVMESLQPLLNEELSIKLPNDIVLKRSLAFTDGRCEKLAGVSAEIYLNKLCIGIGINVLRDKGDQFDFSDNRVAFMEDFATKPLTPEDVFLRVLGSLNDKLVI